MNYVETSRTPSFQSALKTQPAWQTTSSPPRVLSSMPDEMQTEGEMQGR